jgi:PAS domain S-box-containing protein
MPDEIFIPFTPLLHNISLLLAMVVCYDVLFVWQDRMDWRRQTLVGIVLGAIGIAVIVTAWQLKPGFIFDGRSVLLAITGLFFSTLTTAVAMLITALFRLYQGGGGAWAGVCIILVSGGLGIAWRRWRRSATVAMSAGELYSFGLIVHLVRLMVPMLALPLPEAGRILSVTTVPILMIYPLATMALGLLMNGRQIRQWTTAALLASESLLRTTLYSIGEGVITTDAQDCIRQMNPVAEHLTGWLEVEAQGKAAEEVFRLVHEITGQRESSPVRRVTGEGGMVDYLNHTLVAKDDRTIPVSVGAAPIRGEGGELTGVVLVCRDQSKERLATRLQQARLTLLELAAHHSLEELLTKVLDEIGLLINSPIAYFHLVHPLRQTLLLKAWSSQSVNEFGQPEGKGGHNPIDQAGVWLECVQERRPVIRNDCPALPSEQGLPVNRTATGRELVVPIMRNDKVMAILGVKNKPCAYTEKDVEVVSQLADMAWEMTCRKQAEEDLGKLSQAIKQSPASIVITDTGGNIEFANPTFTRVTGYTLDEVRGKNPRLFKTGETPSEAYRQLWQTITTGGEWRGEFHNRRKDGTLFWERAVIAPIRDRAGQIVNFLAVKEDITDLRHVEQQYQRLFTEMLEGFALHEIICDGKGRPVDYRFLSVNPAFERLTGLRADDVVGKTVLEVMPETEAYWIDAYGRVALTGIPEQIEHYSRALQRVFAITAFRPAANQFACLFSDTTERKRAEELVVRSRDYHLRLFEHFPTLIWRAGLDGKCDYFNQTWLTFTGRTLEQELNDGWAEGVHPDDRDRCLSTYLDAFRQQHPFEMEYRLRHHDGSYRWLIDYGRPFFTLEGGFAGFIGSCHDISEQKHTLDQLQESEERFRQLFERSDDAIILFEKEKCSIIDLNGVAANLFGFDRDELRATGLPPFVDDASRPEFTDLIRGLEQGGSIRLDQVRMHRRDGTPVWISVRGKLIPLLHQEVVFCSFRDITNRLRLEEEAKVAQTKLIQTDKMASLGLLVSGIAHEINNPNNAIMFNSQLLAKAWQSVMPLLDEYQRENGDFKVGDFPFSASREILPKLFSGMVDGSTRIRNIVDRLKNFARQDRGTTRERVDVNQVVLDAIAILNHEIKKQCDNFRVAAEVTLPPALGNAQQIEQVVINLVMNALQALPDKKRAIRIGTALTGDGARVAITVADEGVGMTDEVANRLTEPFFTTRSAIGGTGLGLSISASILKENQGTLSFTSTPNEGTTATVLLRTFPDTPSISEATHA